MAAGPFLFPPRHQSACLQANNAFVRFFQRYFPSCHTNCLETSLTNQGKQNNIVWLKQNFQPARRTLFMFSPKFWLLLSAVGLETLNFESGTGKFHLDRTNKSQGSTILWSYQFKFLGNCPPTPPQSECFALSERWILMLAQGGVGGQFPKNLNWSEVIDVIFRLFFQSCRSPHRTVQRNIHSDQTPWASLWRGTRVTWEHELGELRWGLQGGSLFQNARKNFCAEIIFIVGCWNAMIHMKMRPENRANGNGDSYTWLADKYWWKYIYKLSTFWPWNNRFFSSTLSLLIALKTIY